MKRLLLFSYAIVVGLVFLVAPSSAKASGRHARLLRRDAIHDVTPASVLFGIKTGSMTWESRGPVRDAWELKALLNAQLSTWGKDLAREQFVIVGGEHDDATDRLSSTAATCSDEPRGYVCKEAFMLYRAADRMRRGSADWLVVAEEDKYLFVDEFAQMLANYDPEIPQVLGFNGCGQNWTYHAENKNGSSTMPDGWTDPDRSCQAVEQKGGLCGGQTYVFSRSALKSILSTPEQTENEFVAEFISTSPHTKSQSDLATSCLLHARGIQVVQPEFDSEDMFGGTVQEQDAEIAALVDAREHGERILALHVVGTKMAMADRPNFVVKLHNQMKTPLEINDHHHLARSREGWWSFVLQWAKWNL